MSSIALFLVSFIAFFVLGMPIAAAMIISSFMVRIKQRDWGLPSWGPRCLQGLITLPCSDSLFILTAEVMNRTSVADRNF